MAKPERLPWGTAYTEITEENKKKPTSNREYPKAPSLAQALFTLYTPMNTNENL